MFVSRTSQLIESIVQRPVMLPSTETPDISARQSSLYVLCVERTGPSTTDKHRTGSRPQAEILLAMTFAITVCRDWTDTQTLPRFDGLFIICHRS